MAASCALALGCTSKRVGTTAVQPAPAVAAETAALGGTETVERSSGLTRIAKTFRAARASSIPESAAPAYRDTGVASWYGPYFHGRVTANGEIFDRTALSAAHPTLPLPSYVRVTNLENDRSVVVRVNDRGPYVGDRLIDVSERTAELLHFKRNGMAPVRIEYVGRAPDTAEEQATLVASYRGPEPTSDRARGLMLASLSSSASDGAGESTTRPAPRRVTASDAATAPPARAGSTRRGVEKAAFVVDAPAMAGLSAAGNVLPEDRALPPSADQRIFVAFQTVDEFER